MYVVNKMMLMIVISEAVVCRCQEDGWLIVLAGNGYTVVLC